MPPMQQILRMFPDMQVNTPYPIQFGKGDWITVIIHAMGTFTGQMTLPDGKAIAPTGKHLTLSSARPPSGKAKGSSSPPSGMQQRWRGSSVSPRSAGRPTALLV
jgi:hypothetical protein